MLVVLSADDYLMLEVWPSRLPSHRNVWAVHGAY